MTYGPESGTTVLKQRFGPINGKQGHRRLNVLFSRARTRIGLFCSFDRPTSCDTDSSEGVHVLRRYLEYAESGVVFPFFQAGVDADSDFEIEVAERLRRGLVSTTKSGFWVQDRPRHRHPDHPSVIWWVECDGATYHRSKSARDESPQRES